MQFAIGLPDEPVEHSGASGQHQEYHAVARHATARLCGFLHQMDIAVESNGRLRASRYEGRGAVESTPRSGPMKRILFVDDEASLLEGLRRLLRPQRARWETMFATGGEEALRMLDDCPFDVVVTDMRMPGMDGAELLKRVRDRFPCVVRIGLSCYTQMESTLQALTLAH